jgi:hypothetical protein
MRSTGGYVFASHELSAEEARLDMLEELYDRDTQQLLDRVGLERGGRFLEVGAGHGSVVSFLLARCGARGRVVATDIDTIADERGITLTTASCAGATHHLVGPRTQPSATTCRSGATTTSTASAFRCGHSAAPFGAAVTCARP